jgi:hypothetical protein
MLSPLPECVKTNIDDSAAASGKFRSERADRRARLFGDNVSASRWTSLADGYRTEYYLLKKGAVCDEDMTKQWI